MNPDRAGALIDDWAALQEWRVLNSVAATRASYGEDAHLPAPDVALAHRDLARAARERSALTWEVMIFPR